MYDQLVLQICDQWQILHSTRVIGALKVDQLRLSSSRPQVGASVLTSARKNAESMTKPKKSV